MIPAISRPSSITRKPNHPAYTGTPTKLSANSGVAEYQHQRAEEQHPVRDARTSAAATGAK